MKFGTVSTGRYTGADRYTGVAVGRRSTVQRGGQFGGQSTPKFAGQLTLAASRLVTI